MLIFVKSQAETIVDIELTARTTAMMFSVPAWVGVYWSA